MASGPQGCLRAPGLTSLGIAVLGVLLLVPSRTSGAGESPWEATPSGWAGGRLEHVRNLPVESGAFGADRHGKYLYVTTARSFSIYDIGQPDDPRLLSITALGPFAFNEHPDTNGKVLLLSNDLDPETSSLEVWDVRDKSAPARMARFANQAADHTWACVLDCRFAYGSHGTILSLKNPAAPVREGDWRAGIAPSPTAFHGIDEVAPGLVLVASEPTVLLDGRRNPKDPQALAVANSAAIAGAGIPSYARWPLRGRERFALETIETPFSGPCDSSSGGLVTHDTRRFRTTGEFREADVFRLAGNGTFQDGSPPVNAIGCSSFGLAESPAWKKERLVAVAWLEHGVRLLEIGTDGSIREVGGFMAHGTEAAAPVWGSGRVLYVADTARGVDVYRVSEAPGG